MENENELNLDFDSIEERTQRKLKIEDRFAKLSEKVTMSTKEKEEALARLQAEIDAKSALERERDFFKDFSSQSSKYPEAINYQDKIFDKVKSGYSTEDATLAVLAKEGKFNPTIEPKAPAQPQPSPTGGSAPTVFPEKDKEMNEMTTEEKLNALKEAEKRGDIYNS